MLYRRGTARVHPVSKAQAVRFHPVGLINYFLDLIAHKMAECLLISGSSSPLRPSIILPPFGKTIFEATIPLSVTIIVTQFGILTAS
jgi:hypothetical protein